MMSLNEKENNVVGIRDELMEGMTSHQNQSETFAFYYRTGIDVWSHFDYQDSLVNEIPVLSPHATILDLGSWRGSWIDRLVSRGYKVIGFEIVKDLVSRYHEHLRNHNYYRKARMIHGDIKRIGFEPRNSESSYFYKHGMDYSFRRDEEIREIFDQFNCVKQFHTRVTPPTDPSDDIVLTVSFFQKK